MTDPFALEPLSTTVTLEEGAPRGEVEVDVTNQLSRHVRAGVEVRGQPPLAPSWVRAEPATFDLGVNDSRRVTLAVNPPQETEPGEFRFTLRAYDIDRPADVFAESPAITVALKRAARRARPPASGLVAAVVGWLSGGLVGLLVGGLLGWRVFAPGPAGDFESFGEALGAALGEAIAAAIFTVIFALALGWILSNVGVWLALWVRNHSRAALTAGLSFGIGIPWFVLVVLASRLGEAAAVLGWLGFLLLLAANPALGARLLVTRVFAGKTSAPAEPTEPAEPAPPAPPA